MKQPNLVLISLLLPHVVYDFEQIHVLVLKRAMEQYSQLKSFKWLKFNLFLQLIHSQWQW